jgi:hypothetical protein
MMLREAISSTFSGDRSMVPSSRPRRAFYAAFLHTPTGMQPPMRSLTHRCWPFWRARVR